MNGEQILSLVANALGAQALSATHQTFGHSSVTYDVALPECHVIVRANADPQVFATTERNLAVLAALGLDVQNPCPSRSEKRRCWLQSARSVTGAGNGKEQEPNMQWEFLGTQELRESHTANKGHVYAVSMWRTPVPGGWLLMTLNSRSNNPQPVQSFYPDPQHLWTGKTPVEASYLLRPAGAGALPAPNMLLLPARKETGSEQSDP